MFKQKQCLWIAYLHISFKSPNDLEYRCEIIKGSLTIAYFMVSVPNVVWPNPYGHEAHKAYHEWLVVLLPILVGCLSSRPTKVAG